MTMTAQRKKMQCRLAEECFCATPRVQSTESDGPTWCRVCHLFRKQIASGNLSRRLIVFVTTVCVVLEVGAVTDNFVLVVPETPHYRRAAVAHTCVGKCFLEIGCDNGSTVDRI